MTLCFSCSQSGLRTLTSPQLQLVFEHVPWCHGAKPAQVSSVIGTIAQLPQVTGDTYLWLLVDIVDIQV